MRGRGEVDVAKAAPAAARDDDLLTGRHEVGHQLAGRVVENAGARRDRDHEGVAGLAVSLRAEAAAARLRAEVVREAEVAQRGEARVDPQHDGAAAAAVAAIGAALRDVRLAPERGRAVAAVTGTDPDGYAVEEHRDRLSHAPRPRPVAGVRSRPAG